MFLVFYGTNCAITHNMAQLRSPYSECEHGMNCWDNDTCPKCAAKYAIPVPAFVPAHARIPAPAPASGSGRRIKMPTHTPFRGRVVPRTKKPDVAVEKADVAAGKSDVAVEKADAAAGKSDE